jgi:hypothetical protein
MTGPDLVAVGEYCNQPEEALIVSYNVGFQIKGIWRGHSVDIFIGWQTSVGFCLKYTVGGLQRCWRLGIRTIAHISSRGAKCLLCEYIL